MYLVDTNVMLAASAVSELSNQAVRAMPQEIELREMIYEWLADFDQSDRRIVLDPDAEAAALLGVSEMTIRRDLNGHNGPVVLLGGYIVLEPRSATHYLLSDQKTRLVEEKRRAARHAAALLEAHQMAFFDCGTTTPGSLTRLITPCLLPASAIR